MHDYLLANKLRCSMFQVRNNVWTIKTAIDFLSGEALVRTAKVAEELRMHRFVDKDLEDVLQLPLVLWHAWVSLTSEMPNITEMGNLVKRGRHGSGRKKQKAKKVKLMPAGGV